MIDRNVVRFDCRYRGRGVQQVFGSAAEAAGKAEASEADRQTPDEEDPMAAEERILISEVQGLHKRF